MQWPKFWFYDVGSAGSLRTVLAEHLAHVIFGVAWLKKERACVHHTVAPRPARAFVVKRCRSGQNVLLGGRCSRG